MEGMAMGKPIVSTYNRAYPFNLEKEKIGFYVDYGDVQGWKDVINYLLDHPEERLEMGERARHLCKTKYNYGLFAKNVVSEVDRVLGVDTQDRKQNRPEIIPRTVKFGVFNPFF
jgi:glycosyltransferase involved in cell wall biosynthesis